MAEPCTEASRREVQPLTTTTVAALTAGDELSHARRRTLLDRVNPAIRLVAGGLATIPLALTLDWLSASVALGLELVVLLGCGVPPRTIGRRVAPLFLIAPISAVSMLLYGRSSGTVHWHWGPATISDGSMLVALGMFLRIFALAMPATVLFDGVDATRMGDALAQVLHLPARFVLGSLAGLRMFGLFADDWRTMGHARRARGLGDDGRLKRWALMCFSLLVLAIRRGSRLATAMEAKGFGGEARRSWARPSRVGPPDAVALAVSVVVGIVPVTLAAHFGTLATAFT